MEHSTFRVPVRAGITLETEAATLLYQSLQALPAPRCKQGRRYSLAVILSLVMLVKLAGEQKMSGVTGMGAPSRPRPGSAVEAAHGGQIDTLSGASYLFYAITVSPTNG